MGEDNLINYIKNCFDKNEPLYESFHNKVNLLFKEYILVGGMPKVVDSFLLERKQFNNSF